MDRCIVGTTCSLFVLQHEALNDITDDWLCRRVDQLRGYCNDVADILCSEASGTRFKSSVRKKDSYLRFTPTNLHVEHMAVLSVPTAVPVSGQEFHVRPSHEGPPVSGMDWVPRAVLLYCSCGRGVCGSERTCLAFIACVEHDECDWWMLTDGSGAESVHGRDGRCAIRTLLQLQEQHWRRHHAVSSHAGTGARCGILHEQG